MKNTLVDLHNNLMEQLERLMDAETVEEIEREMQRSKAVSDIAKVVVDNSKLVLDATKISLEYGNGNKEEFDGTMLQLEKK